MTWEKPVRNCYHVYSDGTCTDVLFEKEDDCIFGMNMIPIVAFSCGLTVLCLEIMKTHFHCILRGKQTGIQKFKGEAKRLISRYFRSSGRADLVDGTVWIEADAIQTEEELRRKIIYVFRNCTEAGYSYLPECYPWGPGNIFFQKPNPEKNRKLEDIPYREKCRLFHTRMELPGQWECDRKGMLVPASYIDIQYINREVFLSPRQFIAFLNVKKNDLVEMEAADARKFLLRREEDKVRKEVERESKARYGKKAKQLTTSQKVTVATELWTKGRTFSIKQLARLTRLDLNMLKTILHQDDSASSET